MIEFSTKPDAARLGIMQGTPPPPDKRVTLANWMKGPYNQWGFQHVRELIPTAPIRRGPGPIWELPRAPRALRDVDIVAGPWGPMSFGRLLDDTFTDAIAVLHRGSLVFEEYHNAMTPGTPHIAMSMSKSVTATVTGAAIDRGFLSPDSLVTDLLPELAGTSFEGCTVRHILDMRTGTRQDVITDEQSDKFLEILLWQPPTLPLQTRNVIDFFYTLQNYRSHGTHYEYRSILTNVLAWLTERAAGVRFNELASELLWKPLGAEFDASITVDGHGNVAAEIGVSATLRDLARLGEMLRRDGLADATRVVSAAWAADTVTPEPDSIEAFRERGRVTLPNDEAYYRNQWWVARSRAEGGVYLALGIHGQMILVHEAAEVVVVKLSCWPEPWPEDLVHPSIQGAINLAERLA
ncbi:serine hydrolase [Acrocarpospora macrocephala]|uniref:Hydrolase n=1 Tax=Acrocarpospora macrocephala TaxID=150177 RepID=A0A5M3WQ38_9ACTN|nr:serine hydrolase [Acrocarpospora macrocephala]GES08823.1 hydrolase [Acrocarpospora macrocephala]